MSSTPTRKSDKKARFFGGIFGGGRRTSKGNKYDYTHGVEALHYSPKSPGRNDIKRSLEKQPFSTSSFKSLYIHGHRFEQHQKPSWCDICQELILGLYIQAARCVYCRYTCHKKCVREVSLDCPKAPSSEKSFEDLTKEVQDVLDSHDNAVTFKSKNNNLPSFVSSVAELRSLIHEFNESSPVIMNLHTDGTFDGFIRVHMNLKRPVNVSADVGNLTLKRAMANKRLSDSRRPLSEMFNQETGAKYDSGIGSESASSTLSSIESSAFTTIAKRRKRNSRRLSFYLPKGTYKPLHVTNTTTAREVISALLSKYNVTDNPKKFALYEKSTNTIIEHQNKDVIFRRLQDDENPLLLRLSWGAKNNSKAFALKEDEDGTVQWMNFEVPELVNFLEILQIEEDSCYAQILQKYERYAEALRKALELNSTGEETW